MTVTAPLTPWYAKSTFVLFGISLVINMLYVGRYVFVPLMFAALLSVLLFPLSNFLERHKIPRLLSIFIAVTIACIFLLCLSAIIAMLYAFLMLMYKDLILQFMFEFVTGKSNSATLTGILQEARAVINKYLVGLMIQTAIIAVLNSTALLLLGVDYAILFGILAAILNLIPYVGIMIGGLLPMLMAMITMDSAWYPLGVIAAFSVIQLIDNNIIIPYIVASRISINALVSIVAVIFGGMLWGISGMFLSLPAVAIFKVIFDRIESLKPWGLILGDAIPPKLTHKAVGM